jgi:hypothetical protein
MDLKEVGWERVDWIQMAQDKDNYRALENMVITFGFRQMSGIN